MNGADRAGSDEGAAGGPDRGARHGDVGAVRRAFPARASALRDVRAFIRDRAEGNRLAAAEAEDLAVMVSEAFSNAVVHADGDHVEVGWRSQGRRVEVEVVDQGVFRSQIRIDDPDGRIGGHGIPLMAALADRMEIEKGTPEDPGTTVRVSKTRRAG